MIVPLPAMFRMSICSISIHCYSLIRRSDNNELYSRGIEGVNIDIVVVMKVFRYIYIYIKISDARYICNASNCYIEN
jgi:hypothetical protein